MNKTKYPISKIRSGEVAVKLTSIEQYEKLEPSEKVSFFRKDKYYAFINGKLNDVHNWNITCDFHQIDWEEGKEEVEVAAEKYAKDWEEIHPELDPEDITPIEMSKIDFIQGAEWQKEQSVDQLSALQSTIDQLTFQLKAADAENERLKRDMGDITRKNVELVLENETLSSKNATLAANYFESYQQLQQQQTSQPQELSLKQRMAWELYVSGFNHGIADKWTIAECYRSANIFLNYKGGENE